MSYPFDHNFFFFPTLLTNFNFSLSIIIALSSSREYDLESTMSTRDTGPATNTSLVLKTGAVWLTGSDSVALGVLPSHVTGLTRSEGSSNVRNTNRRLRDVKGTAKALRQLESSASRDVESRTTCKRDDQLCCNTDDSMCNIDNQTTLNTENKIVYYNNPQFINDNEG